MLFTGLFAFVDSLLQSYVGNAASQMMALLGPSAMALATILIALWGWRLSMGGQISPQDIVGKLLRVAIPIGVGLSMSRYTLYLADWLMNLPVALLAPMAGGGSVTSMGQVLDRITQAGVDVAAHFMSQFGVFSGDNTMGILGVLILVCVVIMSVFGGVLIIISKAVLAVLLGLAPLAIILLILPSTQKFFEAWLAQCLNCGLVMVITGALLSMFSGMVTKTGADFVAAGEVSTGAAASMIVMTLCVGVVLYQGWSVASALAGGTQLSTMGFINRAMSRTQNAASSTLRNVSPLGIRHNKRYVQRQWAAARRGGQAVASLGGLRSPAASAQAAGPRTLSSFGAGRTGTNP